MDFSILAFLAQDGLTTGAIYLAVTLALSLLVTRLERRFARAS